MVELGIVQVDALDREIEAALLLDDHKARAAAFDAVQERCKGALNPVTLIAIPNFVTAASHVETLTAQYRLVETELALEQKRAQDGTYPEKIELPVDASTGNPIEYERSGDRKGWTLRCARLTLSRAPP